MHSNPIKHKKKIAWVRPRLTYIRLDTTIQVVLQSPPGDPPPVVPNPFQVRWKK